MSERDVAGHIEELVAEEQRLLEGGSARAMSANDRRRLDEIGIELDRYYDLLRQRRAREEFGQDPERARLRSEDTVERYLQ